MKTARNGSACNCLAIRKAARQVTQFYDAALARTGLRVTQYSLLAVLERRGPSTVQTLADVLVMDRSTLGHNLRPLEREGLVVLARDESDRRSRRVELTSAGRARLARAARAWASAQDRFESRCGAVPAATLRQLLARAVASAVEH